MARFSQDHFHLYLTTTTFTGVEGKFKLTFQNQQFKIDPAVKFARALTGKLLINRLIVDDAMVKYRDSTFTVVVSPDEIAAFEALNGQSCFYIPNLHEEGDAHDATDAYRVILVIVSKAGLNAAEDYWLLGVQLTEDTL